MRNQIMVEPIGDEDVAYKSGDRMKLTLSDDDRRAVDMLLDRDGARTSGNGGSVAAAAMGGRFQKRIEQVEKVLELLSEMPASEPPPDLVNRVVRRIDETPQRATPAPTHPASQTARTHA